VNKTCYRGDQGVDFHIIKGGLFTAASTVSIASTRIPELRLKMSFHVEINLAFVLADLCTVGQHHLIMTSLFYGVVSVVTIIL